uniref:Uncharacterized protein n=1 Tax=Aegilops tauschii subsp. strangulata TaxID=200361 RepID=A0A453LXI8_AEGTS
GEGASSSGCCAPRPAWSPGVSSVAGTGSKRHRVRYYQSVISVKTAVQSGESFVHLT